MVRRPLTAEKQRQILSRLFSPEFFMWRDAVRHAEATKDLAPIVKLLRARDVKKPQAALDLLATLLERVSAVKWKRGGQPTKIFERSEAERQLEAAALVRDFEAGVAGTFEDLAKSLGPRKRHVITTLEQIPRPVQQSRSSAIEKGSRVSGISEDKLGDAVTRKSGFHRRKKGAALRP
jgi:hypothetical protein